MVQKSEFILTMTGADTLAEGFEPTAIPFLDRGRFYGGVSRESGFPIMAKYDISEMWETCCVSENAPLQHSPFASVHPLVPKQ